MKALRLYFIVILLGLCCALLSWGTSASRERGSKNARSAQTIGRPMISRASTSGSWLRLSDGAELTANYKGEATSAAALQQRQGAALSLAAADFDEDGVPDLVGGYSLEGGGAIVWQRGNVDALYPNSPEARDRRAKGQFTDAPFFPDAHTFVIPAGADFIGAGDFDADGHWDVVTAARGGNALLFLRGDGHGGFASPERVELPGNVTALATGEVNRRDGLTDIVVGVMGKESPQLLVFENAAGALRAAPESVPMPAAATSIALGQLDESYEMDMVVAAGNQLVLIQGRDRRTSLDEASRTQVVPAQITHAAFQTAVVSVAVGDFVGDYQEEIALLTEDGTVHLMERRMDPATSGDAATQRNDAGNATDAFALWRENDAARMSLPVSTASLQNLASQKLVSAKVSSLPKDDLIVIDADSQRLHVITAEPNAAGQEADESVTMSDRRLVAASLSMAAAPAAVLPMRLNNSALQSLVVSGNGGNTPLVLSPQAGATLVVNSNLVTNARDTVLTLNEAILVANGTLLVSALTAAEQAQISGTPANPGLDTIKFNIPGGGVPTITDNFAIPVITDALTLDGTTQPAGKVAIESAAGQQTVLRITAGNTTVRGMVVNRGCRGIQLATNGNNVLEGNFIGTSTDGTTAGPGNPCGQIEIDDSINNTIGGTTAAARNILSGGVPTNNNSGVLINGPNATGNLIRGNYIGPDVTGNAVLGNRDQGIYVATASCINNTIGGAAAGAGNVISGNGRDTTGGQSAIVVQATGQLIQGNTIGLNKDGTNMLASSCSGIVVNSVGNITIGGTSPAARNVISGNGTGGIASHAVLLNGLAAANCLVQGNYIGTNAAGTAAIRNVGHGISLPGASNNNIGGAVAGARNLISGNILDGVNFSHVALVQATGNQVQGNYIGTDVSGTLAIGNQSDGIEIGPNTGGMGTLIGGSTASLRNVISGNRENGIFITSSSKTNPNRMEGNYIGANTFGTGALGNGQHGIFFVSNTDGQNIGGTNAGAGNLIAFSVGPGIACEGGRVIGGPVLGNSIFSNSGLGIDREDNGPSANASTRSDNTPVLTLVNTSGNTTTINGTLQENHTNSVNYTVQFFSNVSCDPSGYGEGKTLIGQTTVNITNSNPVNFTANITPAVPGGRYITAVAIGPNTFDPTGPQFSSEFSFCFRNSGSAPPEQTTLRVFAVAPDHGGDIGSVTSTVTGEGISQGATVLLRKNGEPDIVGTSVSVVTAGTSLRALFDLTGRTRGVWDVVVTNPNSTSATLPAAFTIEAGRAPEVWTDIVGRTKVAVFPAHDERYFLLYGNSGNVDADATLVRLYVPPEMEIRFVEKVSGEQPVIGRIDDGSGAYTFGKYIEFYLPKVPADSSGALLVLLRPLQINQSTFNLRVWGYSAPSLHGATSGTPDPSVNITAQMTESTTTSFGYDINVTSAGGSGTITVHGTIEPNVALHPPTIEVTQSGQQLIYTFTFVMPTSELPTGSISTKSSIRKAAPFGGLVSGIRTQVKLPAIPLGEALKTVEEVLSKPEFFQGLRKPLDTLLKLDCLKLLKDSNGLPVLNQSQIDSLTQAIQGAKVAKAAFGSSLVLQGVGSQISQTATQAMSQITDDNFVQTLGINENLCKVLGGQCSKLQSSSSPDERERILEEVLQKVVNSCPETCPGPPPMATPASPFHVSQARPFEPTQMLPSCKIFRPFRREMPVHIVTSHDPNDKVGSAGTSDQHYVRGVEPFRYEILFENLASATAAAKQVVITDQLDVSKFDLATLELGTATFGAQVLTPPSPKLKEWSTDLDLRPSRNTIMRLNAELDRNTGIVTWRFTSLDPATGQISTAPDGGFLPPNLNQPEGSGAVFFTIKPKPDLAQGTRVLNHARIIFDANAPIDTAQWLNTIDNSKPVSQVAGLAATQNTVSFPVNWSGTDTGAGVANYTIYVSDNGGPFTIWLDNTPATTAVFTGQPGRTYAFYSIATDGAGNREDAPSTADATTTISNTAPVVQFSSASYTVGEGDGRVNISLTRSGDTTSSASVNYATNDAAGLTNCNVINGIASPRCDYTNTLGAMSFAAGETTKTFSIAIVDDSYAEGNETFTVSLNSPTGTGLGAQSTATVTIIDNDSTNGTNPIDNTNFFVRQQYIDFLNREPDSFGFSGWVNTINNCATDHPGHPEECDRIHVSQQFFQSAEFQERGYFVYRFYDVAFGRKPDYGEFVPDLASVSGFLDANQLEAAKVAFINGFMARPAFANVYNPLNNTQYVDTLLTTAAVTLPPATRQAMINGLNNSTLTRAQVLRQIVESSEVSTKYNHQAYAVMEYFGYLRRQPDIFYLDWIAELDRTNNPRGMVTGFVTSQEYRSRFGP